jgi:hypothetical protein
MGGVGRVRSAWLALAFVAVLASGAQGVQFEVSARTTKCIAEEIQSHVVVVGDYKIVHSDEALKVTVKVRQGRRLLIALSLKFCCLGPRFQGFLIVEITFFCT